MANYKNAKVKEPNVVDCYKQMALEEIKADLKAKSFPYAVLMENLLGDFNISTVFRNANAFGAKELYYLGKKKYDPRGCVGVQYYSDIRYLPNYESLSALKANYKLIAIENTTDAVPMEFFEWPQEPVLLCFGEEGRGLSDQLLGMCESVVKITQYGSVRSLNVGTASGIAMFSYVQGIMNHD